MLSTLRVRSANKSDREQTVVKKFQDGFMPWILGKYDKIPKYLTLPGYPNSLRPEYRERVENIYSAQYSELVRFLPIPPQRVNWAINLINGKGSYTLVLIVTTSFSGIHEFLMSLWNEMYV